MSMSPGDGAKLASAVERMAAALEKANTLNVRQGARVEQLVTELYALRMMMFLSIKFSKPDIAGELEAMLEKLTPPEPPKVLAPEPEQLSIEERVAAVMERILKTPVGAPAGARPTSQRPPTPQTGHQKIPQGAQLGQAFRDKLKAQGAAAHTKAKLLVPEPDDDTGAEGVDLRKFAKGGGELAQ